MYHKIMILSIRYNIIYGSYEIKLVISKFPYRDHTARVIILFMVYGGL